MSSKNPIRVLCFIRSPISWGSDERAWLLAGGGEKPTLNTRTNILRLLCAAEKAVQQDAPLWIVEGWRIHAYERLSGEQVLIRGAAMAGILLRALQQAGLLSALPELKLQPRSRCTVQEVDAFIAAAGNKGPIFAVAGPSCPSIARVQRLFRTRHGLSIQALGAGDTSALLELFSRDKQKTFVPLCFPSGSERLLNALSEGVNWGLHLFSELVKPVLGFSFEVWLAQKLRSDER